MLEKFFYWLIDRLADFLGGLNPERKKKIEAIKAEGERLDALAKDAEREAKISEAQYQLSVDRRKEFDRLIEESIAQEQESRSRLSASQERVRQIEDETQRNIDAVRNRSDADRFGGVPKSG